MKIGPIKEGNYMLKNTVEEWQITVRARHDGLAPPVVRIRQALKLLGRGYDLQCVDLKQSGVLVNTRRREEPAPASAEGETLTAAEAAKGL